jgi:O-antigen/teichoic acid export membrane protein
MTAVVGLVSVSIYTRLLSTEQYGVYILGLTGAAVVGSILFGWIKTPLVRLQSEGEHVDVRATALVSLAAAAALLVAGVLLVGSVTSLTYTMVASVSLLCAAISTFELSQEVMRARLNPAQVLRSAVLRSLLGFGFGLAAVLAGWGGIGLMLGIATGFLVTSILYAPKVWGGVRQSKPSIENQRMFLAIGGPMALTGFLYALYGGLDRLVVGWLLGTAASGQYGASYELARQIILFPSMSIAAAMFPLAVRLLATEGQEAAREHLQRSIELLLAIIAPMAIGFAIIAPAFANLFLGVEFRAAAVLLIPILSITSLIMAVEQIYIHTSFHLAKRPRYILLLAACMLVTHLALIIPFITSFGIVGAAYSYLISATLGLTVGAFLTRRAFPLPVPLRRLWNIAAAVAAMAVVTATVRGLIDDDGLLALGAMILSGMLSYGAAAWILNISDIRITATKRLFAMLDRSRDRKLVETVPSTDDYPKAVEQVSREIE